MSNDLKRENKKKCDFDLQNDDSPFHNMYDTCTSCTSKTGGLIVGRQRMRVVYIIPLPKRATFKTSFQNLTKSD